LPDNPDEWLTVSEKFETLWDFPHCLAAMDGKHIVLQAPINSGSEFHNYKSFFSIVLFALVDAEYNFLYANIGCQGRISDGGVLRNSDLFKKLENNSLNLPAHSTLPGKSKKIPYVFLGDEAFPLTQNLMKPYSGLHPVGSRQRIFNYRLSRSRRVVENVFGIMSATFRVLRKPLLLEPNKAEIIVMAVVHLHNFLRNSTLSKNTYVAPTTLDKELNGDIVSGSWRNDSGDLSSLHPIKNVPRRSTELAKEIRDDFSDYFITNGAISWQFKHA